jgi:AAA family ATP:ADP antiporter
MMAGLALVGKSSLLQAIALYILLYAVTGTFLYVFQGRLVEQLFESDAARTLAFARIDFWAQALTLIAQIFFTHRLVAKVGIPISLTILPIATVLGFGSLWLWPGFAALAILQVLRRGLHHAVDRPVREMLYIPLAPDAKYKAKSFIDTFVYRSGDFIGVWMTPLLQAMSLSLGLPGLGMSALWLGGAAWLGGLVRKGNVEAG